MTDQEYKDISIKEFPDRSYTGIDLTPRMIEVAQEKKLDHSRFLVGDSENLPFENVPGSRVKSEKT